MTYHLGSLGKKILGPIKTKANYSLTRDKQKQNQLNYKITSELVNSPRKTAHSSNAFLFAPTRVT